MSEVQLLMREGGEELELVHETCDASPDDLPAVLSLLLNE